MKVLAQDQGPHELDVMLRIRETALPENQFAHIVRLLDHFQHKGETGTHLCLILELMWQDTQEFSKSFITESRISLAKRISEQVLKGVDVLHTCGIIHNGIFCWLRIRT